MFSTTTLFFKILCSSQDLDFLTFCFSIALLPFQKQIITCIQSNHCIFTKKFLKTEPAKLNLRTIKDNSGISSI